MKTKTSLKKSFKFLPLASALIVAAVMALCPTPTRANTIALDFTGGAITSRADATFGWAFSLIPVRSL